MKVNFKQTLKIGSICCLIFFIQESTNAQTNLTTDESFHLSKVTCIKCHTSKESENLIFLTGERIPKTRTPELCGQCHGVIKRDWSNGIHGKKVNFWNKKGELLSCTKCHDAHKPKFPKFKADPPVQKPKYSIPKGHEHE